MDKRRKNRFILLYSALFFLGFPLAGMLYVYNKAHSTMRVAAIPFAQEATAKILGERDYEELHFLATMSLKHKLDEIEFKEELDRWGAYIAVGEFATVRSNVRIIDDMTWQFVELITDVKFEHGSAKLKFTAARRSTMLEDWRIEEFELSDPTVEQPK